jgi:topoisomerase-4 subunit A
MSKHTKRDDFVPEIRPVSLEQALSERYLAYALSTITARSLPDVRDGLKPVQRRLLYAMRLLKLDPTQGFKKCARVVGDVIGKYHPHGDVAVYEALVRLAQDFAQRYPLVDGQGNFGNIDGDNAAAMRYTEARLTAAADLLLQGLDEDTVDFRATYDGEEEEPIVLPAAYPNLLANGASGIAVGMATSIPPHNTAELIDAALHLIKHPNATAAKLVELVPGPDFPTGGIIVEARSAIEEAYATGRGSFRVRSVWHREDLPRAGWQVVVTQIPYQVAKSRLIEKIADLIGEKKLPLLEDVRDESAEDIRLVLVPKSRNIEPELLMESLFRLTELESRFPLNLNVLDGGRVPKVMGLREALRAWLDHRHDVLQRRSRHRLAKIEQRLEILGGLLVAYLNLDELLRIIRTEDEPKPHIMQRFKLSDVQTEAILNMRLRSLRKLEEMEIRNEHKALSGERDALQTLLGDEKLRWAAIAAEMQEVKAKFGPKTALGRRRTQFSDPPPAIEIAAVQAAMVEREPITIVLSDKGWIRALKGHQETAQIAGFKEGDRLRFALHAETTDKIVLFATNGRAYTLSPDKLPGGRGYGDPVRLLIELGNDQDSVALFVHKPGTKRLVAALDGRGFVVPEDEMIAQTKNGKQVLNVDGEGEAALCVPVPEKADFVATIGENRKMLLFPLAEVPEMSRGRGVKLQAFRDGGIKDASIFRKADGLSWTDASGRTRVETDIKEFIGARAQAGRLPPKGFNKSGKFSG